MRTKKIQLNEGIDIDDMNRTVAFNPSHQNYVNTNDLYNPHPIYSRVRGYKVISVFERETTEDRQDGNPLIYALKEKLGWRFANPSYDLLALMRRFVAVTKELKESFDTIVTTPSSNKLNLKTLKLVERIVPHTWAYEQFFIKYTANEVYEDMLDYDLIEQQCQDKDEENRILRSVYWSIKKMNKENDGIFSYKYIETYLRKFVMQSMRVSIDEENPLAYSEAINGKKVLVIDDTVTSGKTVSDSAKAILDMYDPKEIVFLTLFSPLKKAKK